MCLFCSALLSAVSSFTIILLKRDKIALLYCVLAVVLVCFI